MFGIRVDPLYLKVFMKNLKDRVLYTSLKNQRKIEKACQPLIDHFDLSYFYYFKVSNEGDYGFFGNQVDWGEYFFLNKLHLTAPCYFKPCNFKKGANLSLPSQEEFFSPVATVAQSQFAINYALEFGYKSGTGIEFFGFASRSPEKEMAHLYLNEIDILKLFTKKLREENPKIFSDIEDNLINIASQIGPTFHKPDVLTSAKIDRVSFLKDIGIQDLSLLSKREMDVAARLVKGYSASEIGFQLNLSKRTVESYLENMKNKLHCHSKAELIQKCFVFPFVSV